MVERLVDISVIALCVVARMENCSFRASLILSICFSRCFRFSLHTFFWCLICFALFLCSAGGYSFSILEFNFFATLRNLPAIGQSNENRTKASWIHALVPMVYPSLKGGFSRFVYGRFIISSSHFSYRMWIERAGPILGCAVRWI